MGTHVYCGEAPFIQGYPQSPDSKFLIIQDATLTFSWNITTTVLPNNAKARKLFVTTGGLKKVQEIKADPTSQLAEYITIINNSFPPEIVKYYSPGYSETLLNRIEGYEPPVDALA